MNDTTGPAVSGTALIWAIAAMFVAVVAGVVILAVALPEDGNPAALVGQLLASFATLTVALGALFKIGKVEQKVDGTAEDTQRIVKQTNGNLDQRIRTLSYDAMRTALEDHLADEDAKTHP